MFKLFLSMIFGTDMRNSLVAYMIVTAVFAHAGWPIPTWPWSLSGIATVILFGHLPDFDLIPYRLILKDKVGLLFALGIISFLFCWALMFWLSSPGFWGLGLVALLAMVVAYSNGLKVIWRASHWPIWHYPLPVIAISAGLTWLFARQYAPAFTWYYELLTAIPLVLHFGHDCLQEQGFPLFSFGQRFDAHWRLSWPLKLDRVPTLVTAQFYADQAANLHRQTALQDLDRRADPITWDRVAVFLLLLCAALLSALLLG